MHNVISRAGTPTMTHTPHIPACGGGSGSCTGPMAAGARAKEVEYYGTGKEWALGW